MRIKLTGFLLVVLALTLLSSTASAAYIQCAGVGGVTGSSTFAGSVTLSTFNGGSASQSGSTITLGCASFVVPTGYTLNQVDVQLVDDAQNPGGNANAQVLWTWNTFTGVTQAGSQVNSEITSTGTTFNSCVATSTQINSTCPTIISYSENVTSGNTFNAVTVNVSSAAGSNGGVGPDGNTSANLYIQYDYTPNGSIPEPATMALLGGGLVALAAIVRRRRS